MRCSSERLLICSACAFAFLAGACGSRAELDTSTEGSLDAAAPLDAPSFTDACITNDNLYAVCNGPNDCFPTSMRKQGSVCASCLSDPNDPTAVGLCLSRNGGLLGAQRAADGEVYVAVDPSFSSAGAWYAYPYEVGALFANNGGAARVRYADWTPWNDAPLPLSNVCPTFSDFRICGGNCAICLTLEDCTGRSPNHPYGLCVGAGCRISTVDGGWYGCGAGESCLVFQSSTDGQPLANLAGFCFDNSTCQHAELQYPGGATCHAIP